MSETLHLGIWSRQRVRLVRQTELAECGLAALAMVSNFYGLGSDLATLRRQFTPSVRGATLKSLMSVADQLGLTPRALKVPLSDLSKLHVPAILHWDMDHYVVLERVAGARALVHNPEGSSRWLSLEEVSSHFTGVALELRPSNDFRPDSRGRKLRLRELWRRATGLKRAAGQIAVLSLVLEAFVLTSPYYMQVAIDSALPALDYNLLSVLALGFGLFTILNAAALLLRSFVLLSTGTSLGYGIATNIALRLFRLPISWFEKRHVGDVLSRFQSVTPVQQFLTQGATSALLDGTLALFTLALMFFYSPALALLALFAFTLLCGLRALTFSLQRGAQEEAIITVGREQSTMIESIRSIVTLRLFGQELPRHALWQTRLTDATNAAVHLARVGLWQSASATLIIGLETIASGWLAIRLVMNGGFSIGMTFAFMAYKTQFLQRGASLIDQIIAFRMLGLHLDRLADIALTDPDESAGARDQRAPARVNGGIELRDVSYRYSPADPLVLNRINLVISPGEHIAITGPSGGGKTTLIKILLSLIEPDEGVVLIDGEPLSQFGRARYREHIGAVLQDDNLFSGSLAENIALFDDSPDMDRVVQAAQLSAIHNDISAMPMKYDTLVGDMGSSLSGGQKQRVLLARALYRRPSLLIMDEGTSHLDAVREQEVNRAVGELGITRVIIAHRMETIAAATRILAVAGGQLSDVTDSFRLIKAPVPIRVV